MQVEKAKAGGLSPGSSRLLQPAAMPVQTSRERAASTIRPT